MTREPTKADEPTAYVSVPSITSNGTGPHVAPPASATAGTGRAMPWRYLINHGPDGEENYANVYTDNGELVGNLRIGVAMKIVDGMNALASEHQRGLAEGKRIGIEEAATIVYRARCGEIDADLRSISATIRALNAGTKPEVDPNAWAFKNGLEST